MKISTKIFFLSFLITSTLLYSMWERNKIDALAVQSSEGLIIKKLPEVAVDLYDQSFLKPTKREMADILEGTEGLVVHFWGTWCAPCEVELPEFLNFSKNLEKDGIKVLLLSVNDELPKMKKFMKRLGVLPKNVLVGLDNSGLLMDAFGTVKVPETYIFNETGRHVKKFVGPQDWAKAFVYKRIRFLLNRKN